MCGAASVELVTMPFIIHRSFSTGVTSAYPLLLAILTPGALTTYRQRVSAVAAQAVTQSAGWRKLEQPALRIRTTWLLRGCFHSSLFESVVSEAQLIRACRMCELPDCQLAIIALSSACGKATRADASSSLSQHHPGCILARL
jgi:hypothetical protein